MKLTQETKMVKRLFLTVFALVVAVLGLAFSGEKAYAADDETDDSEIVYFFSDKNFQAYINEILGVEDLNADIRKEDMEKIQEIDLSSKNNISNISAIKYMPNLKKLCLDNYYGNINLSEIGQIKSLEYLSIKRENLGHDIKDITALGNLTNLTYLDLSGNMDVTDISALKSLTKLESLNLMNCKVTDISVLENLTNLTYLDLCYCGKITDISALKKLSKLTNLRFNMLDFTEENAESHMSVISSLKNLKELYIAYCDLKNEHTVMFENLKNLETLYIHANNITDYSFITKLPNLKNEFNGGDLGTTSEMIDINIIKDTHGYIIDNGVKDHNGNIVVPNEIGESEIVYYIEDIDSVWLDMTEIKTRYEIKYDFIIPTSQGSELKASHCKYITVNRAEHLLGELKVNGSTEKVDVVKGNTVSLSVNVEGGFEEYTYEYYFVHPSTGVWTKIKDYSKDAEFSYKMNSTGKRIFAVRVKDSAGNIVETNQVTVQVHENITANLTINNSTESCTMNKGETVTLKIAATGGIGTYTYKVALLNVETGKWSVLNDFSTSKTYSYPLNYTGTREFAVTVKDSEGNTVETNRIAVTVPEPLNVTLTTSSANVTVGDKLILTGTATGGDNNYKYCFRIYNKDTKKWYTLIENVTSPVYEWTANIYGNLEAYIEVKDSKENSVTSVGLAVKVCRKPGLYESGDGNWYYLVNEEVNTSVNCFIKTNIGWVYVTNGKLDTSYTGMAKNKYGWWYVKEGKLDTTFTGMAINKNGTWYMKEGKLDTSVNGLIKTNMGWIYVTKGKLNTSYTGMAKNKNGWWYVKEGKLDTTFTGMATNKNGTWYMKKGKLDTSVNGLIKTNIGWVYLANGKLDISFTGLVEFNENVWYVKEGILDFTYTGLVSYNNEQWYVVKGCINKSVNGMIKTNSMWIYVIEGKLDTSYTGMAKNKHGWWYIKNGKLDLTYTGMAKNKNGWWQITNGKLDLTYTGLSENSYGIWYMKNGNLDLTYTGKATYKGIVYNVVKGKVVK